MFISWASAIFFWMTLLRSLGLMWTYHKCIPQLLPWNWKSCTISASNFLMRLSESQSSWRRPTFSFKTGIKVAFWSPLTASEHLRKLASFGVFFFFFGKLGSREINVCLSWGRLLQVLFDYIPPTTKVGRELMKLMLQKKINY